jgi:hypothetical protein
MVRVRISIESATRLYSRTVVVFSRLRPDWEVCISPNLTDSEYNAVDTIRKLQTKCITNFDKDLHLAVSMRSFRAESVSLFVKQLLDTDIEAAQRTLKQITDHYPIVLTRDLEKAKVWLKEKARGTERYGIVVSSQAQRLRPLAIDVRVQTDPVHWFLDGKEDVRSSYYLEDVATEFQVQGLELDWACVTWDGDLRYSAGENRSEGFTPGLSEGFTRSEALTTWESYSFVGSKWQHIHKTERKKYLHAYRVLLTRARQGMVIVLPKGNAEDPTRKAAYYDGTFEYLKGLGIVCI